MKSVERDGHAIIESLSERLSEAQRQRDAAREALRRVQYRPPKILMVPECVGCGARGPIDERLRNLPAEPCRPGCFIAAALAP